MLLFASGKFENFISISFVDTNTFSILIFTFCAENHLTTTHGEQLQTINMIRTGFQPRQVTWKIKIYTDVCYYVQKVNIEYISF